MTTDELVTAVYDNWGESPSNGIVDPGMVTGYANRAQRRLCLVGQLNLTCATQDTVDGVETYEFPGDYLKAECAFLVGYWPGLAPMNVADRDPRSPKGRPTGYYVWGANDVVTQQNQMLIGLQQVPDGIYTMDVYFRQAPNKVVHSSQGAMVNCELKEIWQDAMVDYCLMSIYRRLGPNFQGFFRDQIAIWREWEQQAKEFVNPLMLDRPIPRRDTAGYGVEYYPQ